MASVILIMIQLIVRLFLSQLSIETSCSVRTLSPHQIYFRKIFRLFYQFLKHTIRHIYAGETVMTEKIDQIYDKLFKKILTLSYVAVTNLSTAYSNPKAKT